jgi:hypothetical protein
VEISNNEGFCLVSPILHSSSSSHLFSFFLFTYRIELANWSVRSSHELWMGEQTVIANHRFLETNDSQLHQDFSKGLSCCSNFLFFPPNPDHWIVLKLYVWSTLRQQSMYVYILTCTTEESTYLHLCLRMVGTCTIFHKFHFLALVNLQDHRL